MFEKNHPTTSIVKKIAKKKIFISWKKFTHHSEWRSANTSKYNHKKKIIIIVTVTCEKYEKSVCNIDCLEKAGNIKLWSRSKDSLIQVCDVKSKINKNIMYKIKIKYGENLNKIKYFNNVSLKQYPNNIIFENKNK